jgi:hypothetical protein
VSSRSTTEERRVGGRLIDSTSDSRLPMAGVIETPHAESHQIDDLAVPPPAKHRMPDCETSQKPLPQAREERGLVP